MRYKIRMVHRTPEDGVVGISYSEVEGEPFIVQGWEEFKFFSRWEDGNLVISEVTTGKRVGNFYTGVIEAHDDLKGKLEKMGPEKLRAMIAEGKLPV